MKKKRIILYAAISALMLVAFWFVLQPGQQQWKNEPLHSTMEAVEALSVLLMALFLLARKEKGADDKLIFPALGFLAMGILDSAHAASLPGEQFVFLRAVANLAGALGFALVWLPASYRSRLYKGWLAWIVVAASVMVIVPAFLFPMAFPPMVYQGTFTPLAVTINLFAGFLFIAGTWRFIIDWHHSDRSEDLLFTLIGLFFGLSGLTFQYSMLWSEAWWFWHVLRLIASLLVLGALMHRRLQTVTTLKASLLELKRAEVSVRDSYSLTKTIIDSMHDLISLIDVRDFTIVGVNNAFLKEYGYTDQSMLVGKHCYEVTHRRSDVCAPPDDICPLAQTVRTGQHFAVDHIHYDSQGERIYVEVSTTPIKDETGKVVQVVHVQRNITERKRAEAERERLLSDLARSNKELEQFAYVASHDLQEPLRMVASYVQLLEQKYKGKLDEKADKYIYFAVDGAVRMQNLIDALLSFSRITTRGAQFVSVDTNRAFSQAVSNLTAAIRESHARVTKENLPTVSGDETQLVQLFQNLIGNAIKYRKPDTAPLVEVSAKREGPGWVFSVRDDGIGIDPRHFDTIFQIFQRLHTRQEYPGTGIGLALCKRIVERHLGRIWVESGPDKGSTFFFTIPRKEQLEKI